MKSSATLNSFMAPDIRATPAVLQAACQDVAKHVIALMCLHGIQSLHATVAQVGARTVVSKDYVPFSVQPPAPLDTIQGEAAARLIEYMTLFGIHSISLEPDKGELETLAKGYVGLMAQADTVKQASSPKQAPKQDPSPAPVL